jgi:hypothetical protein
LTVASHGCYYLRIGEDERAVERENIKGLLLGSLSLGGPTIRNYGLLTLATKINLHGPLYNNKK